MGKTTNNKDIILGNFITMSILGLTKINTNSDEIIKYNFKNFTVINLSEFDISPSLDKILFSTYEHHFDYDSEKEYVDKNVKVKLILYDLNTKEQKIILSRGSSYGKFSPMWIDDNNIEYQISIADANEDEKVQTNISNF